MGPKGPGYLWKAERIRNLSIVKNLKKTFSLFIFKSLKNRVVAIGPRGFNWLLTGISLAFYFQDKYDFVQCTYINRS